MDIDSPRRMTDAAVVFLAEYDNTQNDANHIHAVWRDLKNDFGAELLREHYRRDHS